MSTNPIAPTADPTDPAGAAERRRAEPARVGPAEDRTAQDRTAQDRTAEDRVDVVPALGRSDPPTDPRLPVAPDASTDVHPVHGPLWRRRVRVNVGRGRRSRSTGR
ncbi:hypothetical protein [Actinosynnema pretiosum]|uniref:Uncharacterized protein n=1 Tax=Actinosynnema pretiosum TaxID=42197 RepID=A0A290Z9X5_9PSEU|nr:hypothetical protein [Actinosynnema pretiosum]ATE55785.1 hypothetical protein CNX65_22950 [Actinosynnema pretiosum]